MHPTRCTWVPPPGDRPGAGAGVWLRPSQRLEASGGDDASRARGTIHVRHTAKILALNPNPDTGCWTKFFLPLGAHQLQTTLINH